jgi:hypothetical protein
MYEELQREYDRVFTCRTECFLETLNYEESINIEFISIVIHRNDFSSNGRVFESCTGLGILFIIFLRRLSS